MYLCSALLSWAKFSLWMDTDSDVGDATELHNTCDVLCVVSLGGRSVVPSLPPSLPLTIHTLSLPPSSQLTSKPSGKQEGSRSLPIHGPHQADRPQVHQRQGLTQATCNQVYRPVRPLPEGHHAATTPADVLPLQQCWL